MAVAGGNASDVGTRLVSGARPSRWLAAAMESKVILGADHVNDTGGVAVGPSVFRSAWDAASVAARVIA